jgi:hypothetical protein
MQVRGLTKRKCSSEKLTERRLWLALFVLLLAWCGNDVNAQSPPAGAIRVGSTQVQNATNGNCLTENGTRLGQKPCGASTPPAGTSGCPQIQISSSAFGCGYVAGGGTANAQTATLSPAITSLAAGLTLCWLPTAANTTSTPTLAVNGLAATTLVKAGGAALAASDLTTTAMACAIYDGTNFELQNPQSATQTVASGTSALGTSSISSGACAAAVTASATGVATTDAIIASFNSDPTGVTGYLPSTSGMLTIIAYPTSGNVNFKVCNNTSASITPGAITLNWRVVR